MFADLWTLLVRMATTCNMMIPLATPPPNVQAHLAIALFTHSIQTQMNAICFAHQLLGNPQISTLLKAVRCGFLNGCPNISKKLILKHLNPSPATAKGHMKRPRHEIQSTTPKFVQTLLLVITAAPQHLIDDAPIQLAQPPISIASSQDDNDWAFPPIPHPCPDQTSSSMTNRTNPCPTYLHLEPLQTKTVVLSITTSRGCSRSCCWMAAYAFLSYITTNQTASCRSDQRVR
jgi:hypothetical protein